MAFGHKSRQLTEYVCEDTFEANTLKTVNLEQTIALFALVKKVGETHFSLSHIELDEASKNFTINSIGHHTGNIREIVSYDTTLLNFSSKHGFMDSAIHLSALVKEDENVRLYHAEIDCPEENAEYHELTAISWAGNIIGALSSDDLSSLDLFIYDSSDKIITSLYYDSQTSLWDVEDISMQSETEIQTVEGYSTEVLVYDENEMPLINQEIEMWSLSKTRVETPNKVYMLEPDIPIILKTDYSGAISLFQRTSNMVCSPVRLSTPQSQSYYEINPYNDVTDKLKNISGNDLSQARKEDGSWLIPDDELRNNTTEMDNMSKFIRDSIATVPTINGRQVAVANGDARFENRWRIDTQSMPYSAWRISFRNDTVAFEPLTQNGVMALRADRASWPKWMTKLGDFVRGVATKAVEIVEIVVDFVGESIKAAFEIIVEGVQYVFDVVFKFVDEVISCIGVIFEKIKVGFKDLFSWLGRIFNWEDILRCKKAVSYGIDQSFVTGKKVRRH